MTKINAICIMHDSEASECTKAGLHKESKPMKTTEVKKEILKDFEKNKTKEFFKYWFELSPDVRDSIKDFLSSALDRMEKAAREEQTIYIRKIIASRLGYDENSDLDPSPERIITESELFILFDKLKSQQGGGKRVSLTRMLGRQHQI